MVGTLWNRLGMVEYGTVWLGEVRQREGFYMKLKYGDLVRNISNPFLEGTCFKVIGTYVKWVDAISGNKRFYKLRISQDVFEALEEELELVEEKNERME